MKNLPLLILLIILAACGQNIRREANPNAFGGHLAYTEKGILNTFFPHSITELTSSRVIDQIYDGLVFLDAVSLDIKPGIAKKWKISQDGLEYIFSLRNDVIFHDDPAFEDPKSRMVTAHDFVYSFSLLATPDENNKNFSAFADMIEGALDFYNKGGLTKPGNILSGVTAPDDSTLIIRLVKPSGTFLFHLANPVASVIPEEGFRKYGYRNAVGCGPFYSGILSEDNTVLKLTRFENYYLKDAQNNFYPYADSVTIHFATPLSKSLSMLTAKEIQFIQNVPSSELAAYLETNIAMFQSPNPALVVQPSQVLPDWQDVVLTKLQNYRSNNLGMLPLYQMYLQK